ncbi:conserved hypothetical protein [Uncinocarpus reesii 1704]|uniref:DUF6606 domain-containing protein n=1 Tax=Uncinocarpus reesii (strain UAMH 1704) TaxID=336963 RepID=C4JYI4_UNCRE|nr:uncharacterized protein UREG_07235 [Uncinocarpus reesii 1704]EEP82370.1 conserved hypothetical protein [Uncinocarpus reesii 1704]
MSSRSEVIALSFNHIVLPPKLPGKQDSAVEDVERDLASRLFDAAAALEDSPGISQCLGYLAKTLETARLANEGRYVSKAVLLEAFKDMRAHAIVLHIANQNAGLLIRYSSDGGEVIVEAFEASPAAEETLKSQGSLQWDFPGVAVSIPPSEFENPVFQDSLTTFLEKASLEVLDEFSAKTQKAGVTVSEQRDTSDPALITQFLMTLLETNGARIHPPVLRKRVRDDVCWDNSELPWRRSPYWLVLRVCVQRLLYLTIGDQIGRAQYKFMMCFVLARLLDQSVDLLSPELCTLLKTKLCRRLAKLEADKAHSNPTLRPMYVHLFGTIGLLCQRSIDNAAAIIEKGWASFKKEIQRQIPRLPLRADEKDLYLTLPNSTRYLEQILHQPRPKISPQLVVSNDVLAKSTTGHFGGLTAQCLTLVDFEMSVESNLPPVPSSDAELEKLCMSLATRIEDYSKAFANACDEDSEHLSIFVLNIFEMWVHMDKCATLLFPLLKRYHPCFHPEMLDILLLSQLSDMKRLQSIQSYLHQRCTRARNGKMTIFSDPVQGCFADRYLKSDAAANLQRLEHRIKADSQSARSRAEAELNRVNAKYRTLTEQKMQSICTRKQHADGTHDIQGCSHCFYIRSLRRLKIAVHEDFLPQDDVQKRAVLFELGVPNSYSVYRNTTWNIFLTLCPKPGHSTTKPPEKLLCEYSQLKTYNNKTVYRGFSLASDTKSWLGTHYKGKRLPASATAVLLPLGLIFSYYDSSRKLWAKNLPYPLNFSHRYKINLPKELPFSSLYSSPAFAPDGAGPSSYEVVASINQCPSELTVHEFTAHQALFSGNNRRWISILTELGSSNLNFSLKDTMVLLHHLALQVGPRLESDSLRVVHVIFRDASFCSQLIEQIGKHLNIISPNWRENNYMETLLTLTIRLCNLGNEEMMAQANGLLMKIRQVTLTWIALLRDEIRNAKEADVAEQAARYGFMAALLCRRTFTSQAYGEQELDAKSFECFVEATLAMQENLVVNLNKFSASTHNLLCHRSYISTCLKAIY